MKKMFAVLTMVFLSFSLPVLAQTGSLRQQIQDLIATKNATVGVAISAIEGRDTLSINGGWHFPMQSVFKFHIALAVLSQVDRRKFSLDQKVGILKKDLLPNLYSPLREDHPDGATLPLSKILAYTVSKSDNVGCDVLLRLIGGPQAVEEYLIKNNFKNVSVQINEETQQANWDLQFQNWTTPKAANEVLSAFYNDRDQLLSKKSYAFLLKIMEKTETGVARLKGQLPKGTIVAHKTGTSGTNKDGITAAVNDIGIITLPNGKHYAISVFVSNSKENSATNEKIIADISKLVWDDFVGKMHIGS